MDLKPRLSGGGTVTALERGWRLFIPAGPDTRYRLAQLDDHLRIPRAQYPMKPPVRMQLEARVSSRGLPGTWGFGLWNDPFGFSFGPGNGFLRLPALPNAAWFFFSSPTNYLSFRDDRAGNGFLAQLFSSPRFHPRLIEAALAMPFSRKATRRLLHRVIDEDSVRLDDARQLAPGLASAVDLEEWHAYALEWTASKTAYFVDGTCVLEIPLSPRPPLGIVIWIDNQHAGFDPQGRLTYGLETNPTSAWLEIRELRTE